MNRLSPRRRAAALCALALGVALPAAAQQYGQSYGQSGSPYTYGTQSTSGYSGGSAGSQGFAQPGYALKGGIEYELGVTRDDTDGLLYGDVTLSYTPSGSPFGWELGFEGYQGSEGDIAVYGVGKLDLGFGTVSAGIPRSALDTMLDIPPLGGSRHFQIAGSDNLTDSYVGDHYLQSGDTPFGVRFDSAAGSPLAFAGSVHKFEGDVTAADAAVNYQIQNWTLSLGGEHVEGDGPSGLTVVAGAGAQFGQVKGGLYYSNDRQPEVKEGWTGYATWTPLEPLAVTGQVITAREDGREATVYGLSADYKFWEGAYVQGGWFDGEDTPSTYDLSVGWKF